MLLGVIADDFTGASDIANEISRGLAGNDGLATSIYVGVPKDEIAATTDAGVVALKSRSVPAQESVDESLHALEWLLSQGATQVVFKYCSTFDSTADGNIGPVAEALAKRLNVHGVVACPAFPENGRTVYQGHLFVHDRLLNESGLENHPVNPMTDPDIRRWLRAQTESSVGHIPLATVRRGSSAVAKALAESADTGQTLVITDAINMDDLAIIGSAVKDAPLVTGASAIAAALPRNFPEATSQANTNHRFTNNDGPGIVLAGSCSTATREQTQVYAENHPLVEINVASVMEGQLDAQQLFGMLDDLRGHSPLAFSSGDPAQVTALQSKYGATKIAQKLDALFGQTAIRLRDNGYTRIVVAGGETSGAVVDALNPKELSVGSEIDPGVPALYVSSGDNRYGIALKSGNFGAKDFFDKALSTLAGNQS